MSLCTAVVEDERLDPFLCHMPEFRVQSLFEPNTANRGQDSPISHSWGATLPHAANEVREGHASAARLRL